MNYTKQRTTKALIRLVDAQTDLQKQAFSWRGSNGIVQGKKKKKKILSLETVRSETLLFCCLLQMFKMLSFCQKVFLLNQTSSCKFSMCPHCVCTVSEYFGKSCGTCNNWFPCTCTIYAPFRSGLPLPSAKCAKKFHLARLFFIWRKRLAHTFFADIFIFFFVISGMNCASG